MKANMQKKRVNIVWLKRDLRFSDHEPLALADKAELPIILLYIFEPMLLDDPHYSERHWRFVTESLMEMNAQLTRKISVAHAEACSTFKYLLEVYKVEGVYSHQETGLANTFTRDRNVAALLKENRIPWHESQTGAVIRPCNDRSEWDARWKSHMRAQLIHNNTERLNIELVDFDTSSLPRTWLLSDSSMQKGGSCQALLVLEDFFDKRGKAYQKSISKPQESRISCSRMSPYLAWGNISLRQMYQQLSQHSSRPGWRRSLTALLSRLHWHCHFVQKFESESSMQFKHINRGYQSLPYRDDSSSAKDLNAWKEGVTGYPLVDASMRCLIKTGYLNFRMRAMLVSFLTHHLQIDWRRGVEHLASVFLDFDPGIHYPQFQMQAGVTGINTIRIYNPTKQAKEHDSDGEFIRAWCQELAELPNTLLFEPWLLTPMEELMYGVTLGVDYPVRIVDIKDTYKETSKRLWAWRDRSDVKREAERILERHVR